MTQTERLETFFKLRPMEWIPLYHILELHIAQYNARIHDLRAQGMVIENKWEVIKGVKHSWFKYIPKEKSGQMVML